MENIQQELVIDRSKLKENVSEHRNAMPVIHTA